MKTLLEQGDEDNVVTTAEIMRQLERRFGIEVGRKTAPPKTSGKLASASATILR
jgi:hypothetical protein